MQRDRQRARDLLRARTERIGLAVTVLGAAATGGVAGVLAQEDRAAEAAVQPAPVAPDPVPVLPRPRRTVYLQVQVQGQTGTQTQARSQVRSRQQAAPPVRRAAPPARTQQAPVTSSEGS